MIRNLKALGLALVAIFALTAIAASAASAQQSHLTADGPVTLDMEAVGEPQENALTWLGGEIRCAGSIYTGHKYKETPHEPIPSGATTVTLTPHYNQEECVSISGESEFSTIEMTSCDFAVHIGKTTPEGNEEGTYGVTADIACGKANDSIHLTLFAGQSHGFRICSFTIPVQTGLSGAHLTDEGNGHLRLSGTFHGITGEESGLCGTAHSEAGELHVNCTVSGTDEIGETTDISISE